MWRFEVIPMSSGCSRVKKDDPSGTEAEKVHRRLEGFNYRESRACQEMVKRFGFLPQRKELLGMAHAVCWHTGLKLDRLEKRSAQLLVKWFEDNWERANPATWDMCFISEPQEEQSVAAGEDDVDTIALQLWMLSDMDMV
jgi:hypothetical protein